MPTILIDADGCPVVDLTVRIGRSHGVPVKILCDTAHRIEREGAETLVFDKGAEHRQPVSPPPRKQKTPPCRQAPERASQTHEGAGRGVCQGAGIYAEKRINPNKAPISSVTIPFTGQLHTRWWSHRQTRPEWHLPFRSSDNPDCSKSCSVRRPSAYRSRA